MPTTKTDTAPFPALGSTQRLLMSVMPADDSVTIHDIQAELPSHLPPATIRAGMYRLRMRGLADSESHGPGVKTVWWLTPQGALATAERTT